jgi:hypothetical protein
MLCRDWYTTLQLTVGCVLAPNFDKYAIKLDLFTLFKYNKAVDKELFYVLLGGLQILRKVWTDKELQCLRCNCLATPNYQAFGLTCAKSGCANGWCVGGCGWCVSVMCGEFKGKMTELVKQRELRGAMDMGILWLMSAMDS